MRDLTGFLARLRLIRPILVGHSLGGVNAMRYATRVPNCAALVLVDIAPQTDRRTLDHIMRFMMGPDDFGSIDEVVELAAAFNPRRDPRLLRHSLRHNLRLKPDGRLTWKRDTRHLSREWFEHLAVQFETLGSEAAAVRCPY